MTIDKPKMQPLTIEPFGNGIRLIQITALTDEAKKWTEQNAAEYGHLMYSPQGKRFLLSVHAGYDFDQVVAYLTSLRDAQEWPEEI